MAEQDTNRGVDPAILLLVEEIRRGQDALREAMSKANAEIVAAHREAVEEIRGLRRDTPGKLNHALAIGIVMLALFSIAGLITVAGGDVGAAGDATSHVISSASAATP